MPRIDPTDAALDAVLVRVGQAAARRDRTGEGLDEEVGWLHELGLLVAAMPPSLCGGPTWSSDPLAVLGVLRRIGAASLPLGRLIEGHVNAAQLIGLHAGPALRQRCVEAVRGGALLGVWGADSQDPVIAEATASGVVLSGGKAFCSGLGLVAFALVSATRARRTCLFCVDVRDMARADHSQWQVSGMRATRSGGYDFSGIALAADAVVGAADSYYAEPHFLGGMYRMCAVQLGGLDHVLALTAGALQRRGKAEHPLAQLRIGQIASLRALAGHVTEGVARQTAEGARPDGIARAAVLMREGVEHCITAALDITERCLGTEVHREDTAISRLRRDLSFYIRQAAVDDRLMAVGAWHLAQDSRQIP